MMMAPDGFHLDLMRVVGRTVDVIVRVKDPWDGSKIAAVSGLTAPKPASVVTSKLPSGATSVSYAKSNPYSARTTSHSAVWMSNRAKSC